MSQILREAYHIARKKHECNSSIFIFGSDILRNPSDYSVSFTDKRKLVEIRKNKGVIMPGEKYLEQIGIWDGDFSAAKCKIIAHEICCEYELYEEF